MNVRYILCAAITTLFPTLALSQDSEPKPAEVVADVVKAAESLLERLDDSQREQVRFAFGDEEQRRRWSNLPSGIYTRRGLRMGDLNDEQKEAVFNLLRATLSEAGFQQVVDNMNGDEVLKREGGRPRFGKDEYFVSILGEPSTTEPWMWQFGGHHLAINATIVGEQITLSPSLTGGQPVDYAFDGKPVRQLAEEEDKAYDLIGSLLKEQRKVVVVGDHHDDLEYGPNAESIEPKKEGINASDLTPEQQSLLTELIQLRVGILNDTHARIAMEQIERDLPKTYFSWSGPTEKGEAASFRIQGPSVIIEYAPQHLGGDATNHTHAMYRDPSNDYGFGFRSNR